MAPSVAASFPSSVGYSTGNLPLRLEGALQALPEVAPEGCGFLPGQVGPQPVGKLKVELISPHLRHCLGASQGSWSLGPYSTARRTKGGPSVTSMGIYILGTYVLDFFSFYFNSNSK